MHRDPETGQFVAGHSDEPVDLNYADHEFVNFRIAFQNDSGSSDGLGTEYKIEDDVLDLENDELGMLSFMNARLAATSGDFSSEDETRGGKLVTAEIGANLADSEYLNQADTDSGIQVTDNEADVNSFALEANDDPGLWGTLSVGLTSGYNATSDSGSPAGQGMGDNDRIRRVYREETVGGPYIDSTDDINVSIFSRNLASAAEVNGVLYAQMAFVVMEYENRRQEFAPYDPA